jgi:hypothetical protein
MEYLEIVCNVLVSIEFKKQDLHKSSPEYALLNTLAFPLHLLQLLNNIIKTNGQVV